MTPQAPEAIPIAIMLILFISFLGSYLITFHIIAPWVARKQDEYEHRKIEDLNN